MRMRQHPRARLVALGAAALVGSLFQAQAAGASGSSNDPAGSGSAPSLQSQASALENQIESQGAQISALDERYNQAMLALQDTQAALATTMQQEAAAQAAVAAARQRLKADAVDAYMLDTPVSQFGVILGSTAEEMAIRHQYADAAFHNQQAVLAGLDASQRQLDGARAQLQGQQAQASSEAAAARSAQQSAQGTVAAETAALGQVKWQLADLLASQSSAQAQQAAAQALSATSPSAARAAAQQAARAAAVAADAAAAGGRSASQSAAAAVAAANHAASPGGGAPGGSGGLQPAPPAPGGRTAVAAAERELGKPYMWGGAGPDGFDCSGLTMVAWRAAGVYLAHSTAAQYDETAHIPLSDLQPGDLLFYDFGGGGIDHVTMYVGGGQIIEAPHTGANVRILPIWYFDLVGAGRP